MLLRSLELHGYKTFANRTIFEFAGAVTAIVGPNGSGKSNIADSIRWVLGEQSYSLLRGRKTEDMIFSGSELRPRAGMASATVVFDNHSGWLPIEFSEVAVTRRAYRDGQNEYLINGQRVRLKDVSELLAESGLAERTYTIIGQGVVDAALALKAEERRRLFEEAAGIGLHRSRREEALRRLDITRRNLERVQDILAELQPRLRSLERQAKRAQEYEQVRADLRIALRDWYGYYWHRAQRELAAALDATRLQEETLHQTRQSQMELAQKLLGCRQQIQEIRGELGIWHRKLANFHAEREELARNLAVADERGRSLREQIQSLQSEIVHSQEEIALFEERYLAAERDVEQQQTELNEAQSMANEARAELEFRQAERASVEEAVQRATGVLARLRAEHDQLEARLNERNAFAIRLEGEQAKANRAVEEAEKNFAIVRQGKEAAADALQLAQEQYARAEHALQAQREKLISKEAERKKISEAYAVHNNELARFQAEMEVLESAEQTLTGYTSGAQTLLKAAREKRLTGARGALSSQLEVPFELEIAIAAVLGEFVDGVILDQSSMSTNALDLLNAETARGVLLPLDSIFPAQSLPAMDGEGVLGFAPNLVQIDPDLMPVVELLLGNVLVVRDRETANTILNNLRKAGQIANRTVDLRIVTLKGEVFYASGPIFAGQSVKQTTLGRQRRRRELTKKIDEAKDQISGLAGSIRKLDQVIGDYQTQLLELEQGSLEARQAEESARLDYNQVFVEVEQAENKLHWQVTGKERIASEIGSTREEIDQVSAELIKIQGEIDQAKDDYREENQMLINSSIDEYQAQVSHWNMRVAVAEKGLDEAKLRLDERQDELNRVKISLKIAHDRRLELVEALDKLDRDKTQQRHSEAEVGVHIESLQAQIQPAEANLTHLEAQQDAMLSDESEARQALSIAEHHYAQAKIGLARRQEALETWRRRIEDDFGLVAFDYEAEISGPTPLPLEGMVEQLPHIEKLSPEIDDNVKQLRTLLRRMGAINPEAQAEYQEVKQRYEFLTGQVADLEEAESDIRQVITELDTLMEREMRKTFDAVAEEFGATFRRLFGGGSAKLTLTDPDDMTMTGIDIEARLPGRRAQGLSLLSGGERSLTATALIFALLKVSPTPFCLLDEVDAMLDETNVGRFRELLRDLSQNTQFIIVTHNRNTVQVADVIYGVTMGRDSSSQIISLKMDEVSQTV